MSSLFREFENENALRVYPFASGCSCTDTAGRKIGTGVLIDAILYPINAIGTLYISKVTTTGEVQISDDKRVVMTSKVRSGHILDMYDTTQLSRHVGTLIFSSDEALSTFTNVYEDRTFRRKATSFSSSCVFPIANDGVTSIDVGKSGMVDGILRFDNEAADAVRVSTSSDGTKLRFDVIPDPNLINLTSIQHIYCIVDGATPFRIEKIPFNIDESSIGNTINMYLYGIDKDDICSNSHREDSLEMKDTCKECTTPDDCHVDPVPPINMPEHYHTECVDIPNETDSAFYLVSANMIGYTNPISVTLLEGVPKSKTTLDITTTTDNITKLEDEITSNGVKIQVPGLNE